LQWLNVLPLKKKIIIANEIAAAKERIAKPKTIIKVIEKEEADFYQIIEKEEVEFYQNEEEILPIMHKLHDAVMKKEREDIFSFLDEIKSVVPKIAPSFVELHQIGMLIKRTRKTFIDDPEVKAKAHMITDAMKLVYNNKRERRPKSFKLTWEACDNKLKQDERTIALTKRKQEFAMAECTATQKKNYHCK